MIISLFLELAKLSLIAGVLFGTFILAVNLFSSFVDLTGFVIAKALILISKIRG